jgi:hypothetical protein
LSSVLININNSNFFNMRNTQIQEDIEMERARARSICEINGDTSPECAAAWDAVEALQAEAAHLSQVKPMINETNGGTSPERAATLEGVKEWQVGGVWTKRTNFEQYCADNPDAVECRIWDDEESQSKEAHTASMTSTIPVKSATKQEILRLGRIGDEQALAELCKILENDSDPEIRAAAAQSIGMIAEEASQNDAD